MNEFKTFHPIINFIYFAFCLCFAMFLMHPAALLVSCFCGFLYLCILKGKKAILKYLLLFVFIVGLSAIINPAFSHKGATILTYLPSKNPLTLESIIYGIAAGIMIISVIFWFSCFNMVITSDKFIYLFGKTIPTLSLVLSMTLRFIPLFSEKLKEISAAQKLIGKGTKDKSFLQRFKNGLAILSTLVSVSLETSIDAADSMKARGYGLSGRTAYSNFVFDKRDTISLVIILILATYIIFGISKNSMYVSYFPVFATNKLSIFDISIYFSYFAFCLFPIIIEIKEAIKWKVLESRI